MQLSQHNIISKVRDSEKYFIVNQLSGNADILEPALGKALLNGVIPDEAAFIEKGYLVDPAQEQLLVRKKHLESVDRRESDEIQVFFVPWYACNFNCTYCYQSHYENERSPITTEIIDAFFASVQKQFEGRRFYITLFGGEPLLSAPYQRSMIEYFLKNAAGKNMAVAMVTNGFTLAEYIPLLSTVNIREVQVTLDGLREVHDARRLLKNGSGGTFDRVVAGIDAALAAGVRINLRVVVDKQNLDGLPGLAALAKERGWTSHQLFKTQLGRNYDLHYCSGNPELLYSRVEMYEKLYELSKTNPEILEFHKPAYSISRYLHENGDLPEPLFDACPGCKTEWALDYTGGIYACTATVGKAGERLGTFYPAVSLDDEAVAQWRERDITTITECQVCPLSLACGGGCASVARNKTGTLLSPDCRPVRELLELGMSAYFENEIATAPLQENAPAVP